jgi:hypothetical protein
MAFTRALSLARYNWPLYAVSFLMAGFGILLFAATRLPFPIRLLTLTAACVATWYTAASFCAFYLMFDRPQFLGGKWLRRCVTSIPKTCVQISVCVEETTLPLQQVFPDSQCSHLDLFDSEVMTEPAINRAKHDALPSATKIAKPDSIPLDDGSSEFTLVTLAAHEIRNAPLRHKFFAELKRITASHGCVVIAEHLRNLPAALAFGPGLFHFYPRSEWTALATASGLRVQSEFDINPFIHIFVLHHN